MKVQNGGKDTIFPAGQPQKCLRLNSWQEKNFRAINRIIDADKLCLWKPDGHPAEQCHWG